MWTVRINDEAGCDTSAFGFAAQFFCLSRFSLFPQNRGIVLQDGRHFRVPAKIPASDSGSARQRGIGFGFSAPPVVRVAERMKDADDFHIEILLHGFEDFQGPKILIFRVPVLRLHSAIPSRHRPNSVILKVAYRLVWG